MNKKTAEHIESVGLTILVTGIIAGFLALFVSGPWPHQTPLPTLAFEVYSPLLNAPYLVVQLLLWASAAIAWLLGQAIAQRMVREPAATLNR